MKVHVIEQSSVGELRPFIAKCDFIPYIEYGVDRDLIANYLVEELSSIVSKGGFVLAAKEQEEVIGIVSLEKSEWDTAHFGINLSKIAHLYSSGDFIKSLNVKQKLISSLLEKCCEKLLLHISARVHKEDLSSIHALESNSFRLMDVLVTYFFDLRKPRPNPAIQLDIRLFKKDDLPELEEIARACFTESPIATDRYHADLTLSKEKSGELYVKWLADSSQDSSNTILVAEVNGKPVGFNICAVNESLASKLGLRLGTMTLTAVKPSERRKLTATSLLNASLSWFADKVDIMETGGQVSNYFVQRAWSNAGFKIVRSQCTFHWSVLTDSL